MKIKIKESANKSFTPFVPKWTTSTSHKINYEIVYKVLD
mgnify:FL=1